MTTEVKKLPTESTPPRHPAKVGEKSWSCLSNKVFVVH